VEYPLCCWAACSPGIRCGAPSCIFLVPQLYTTQVNTILSYSAGLNDTEKTIAYYWANGPHSETPPGHWALFAQVVSQQHNYDTSANVKLFFALSNALFDAGIACWDCKRAYDSVRPITAVHFLDTGQQIQAWGGLGLRMRILHARRKIGNPS